MTERVANGTLALPFYSNISRADVEYVVARLKVAVELAAADRILIFVKATGQVLY